MPYPGHHWDYLIVTAANAAQAASYREQLAVRDWLGLLPGVERVLVEPDPDGARIGSGGSTARCLQRVLEVEDGTPDQALEIFQSLRILLIHAGGDSRRLPVYGPSGKLFMPFPGESESALSSTLFDRQIERLLTIPHGADGQLVIVAGDVLLQFDPQSLTLDSHGITMMSCGADLELCTRHGVYVCDGSGRLLRILQKPPLDALRQAGAVRSDETALLDVGVMSLDADAMSRIVALGATTAGANDFDLYRELCCALGQDTTVEDYLREVRASGSRISDEALRACYDCFHGVPGQVSVVEPCAFLHFGSVDHLAASAQRFLDLEPDTPVQIHTVVNEGGLLVAHGGWIESCTIAAPVRCEGSNVLAGVVVEAPMDVPSHRAIDVLSGRGRNGSLGWFVRIYDVRDTFKSSAVSDARYLQLPLATFVEHSGGDLWDEQVAEHARCLWNARLFPFESATPPLTRWQWLLRPESVTPEQWAQWRAAERYSFEELYTRADLQWFQTRREIGHATGLFLSFVEYGWLPDAFSARDLAYLFHRAGSSAEMSLASLGALPQVFALTPGEPADHLARARLFHSLGSSHVLLQELRAVLPTLDPWDIEAPFGESVAKSVRIAPRDLHALAFDSVALAITQTGAEELAFDPVDRTGRCVGTAPVRLDLAGGWTDTPPYALERGGCVLNVAVDLDGAAPIRVEARIIEAPIIRIHSRDHDTTLTIDSDVLLRDFRTRMDAFSLAKAGLVLACQPEAISDPGAISLDAVMEALGGGLELTTASGVPSGSGLGSSSILGAVLLAVLHRIQGRELTMTALFREVLRLEQALTTGGGWQDQIGGVVGGVKVISTAPGFAIEPRIELLPSDIMGPWVNGGGCLLFYTGQTRLAKNILQQVVGRYLDRDRASLQALEAIRGLVPEMTEAFVAQDGKRFGRLLGTAWGLKRSLDPGRCPAAIARLFSLVQDHVLGATLLGAGGGGFMLMVCEDGASAARVRGLLADEADGRFCEFAVNEVGLMLEVGSPEA